MVKKKLITYLLWLFGGIFGLHHIYLGRFKHALIWFSTFGGFLIGYFNDLNRISNYIDYANNDDDYLSSLLKLMNRQKSPCFYSTYRFFGSIFVGALYGYIFQYCIPIEFADTYPLLFQVVHLLAPFACAIGVYLVNTESYTKCKFRWPLLGSYIAILPHLFYHPKSMFYCAILSTLLTHWKLEWNNTAQTLNVKEKKKDKVKKASFKKRLFVLLVCASLYTCVATSFFLHNAKITIGGETTTIREAISNFFKSKAYDNIRAFFVRLWYIYKMYGFQRLKEEFMFGVDAYGMARAYEVLGLNESVSQKELDAKCRELSRKWHPDRYKDEEEKAAAQTKFMDIQEACNKVSSYRREKLNKNKTPDQENNEASQSETTNTESEKSSESTNYDNNNDNDDGDHSKYD